MAREWLISSGKQFQLRLLFMRKLGTQASSYPVMELRVSWAVLSGNIFANKDKWNIQATKYVTDFQTLPQILQIKKKNLDFKKNCSLNLTGGFCLNDPGRLHRFSALLVAAVTSGMAEWIITLIKVGAWNTSWNFSLLWFWISILWHQEGMWMLAILISYLFILNKSLVDSMTLIKY